MEETIYLEPIIEEEEIIDLEEENGLISTTNNTCKSGCSSANKEISESE